MIRYKVVDRDRCSCFMNKTSYRLLFEKDVRTEKAKGSVGIFVFDTYKHAQQFIERLPYCADLKGWFIIRVKVHGKGTRMKWRPTYFGNDDIMNVPYYFNKFKSFISSGKGRSPHPHDLFFEYYKNKNDGTMVYDAVTPID